MAAKMICPITREQFEKTAAPVAVVINDTKLIASPREFSTGSLGWYLSGDVQIMVGEKPVSVKIGLNMTISGSKDLPKT